jgi:hypothetical protein
MLNEHSARVPIAGMKAETKRNFVRNSIAVSVLCVAAAMAVMGGVLWGGNRTSVLSETGGRWIFFPSTPRSHEASNGLIYPDDDSGPNELFPDELKTYDDKGTWVYVRKNQAIITAKKSEIPEGINWDSLDCGFHGPKWESRALGCDRPGKFEF